MFGDHLERLKTSFPSGNPSATPYLLYGVFRKEQWSTMFGNAYARHYSSGYVYEVALMFIGACLGPTKMVDSLVWFRSGENPAMSSSAVNRSIGMGEWGTSEEYKSEYEDFVFRIVNVLSERGVGSQSEIEKTIREVSDQFFANHLKKPHRPIAYWHRTLYFFAKYTPQWIKTSLKRNMPKSLGTVLDYRGITFTEALAQLSEKRVLFDNNEMLNLYSYLLEFHRNNAKV